MTSNLASDEIAEHAVSLRNETTNSSKNIGTTMFYKFYSANFDLYEQNVNFRSSRSR